MRKLFSLLVLTAALFAACKEKKDIACPTVDAELVPMAVKDSLLARYPAAVVETWFKVDAVGFCAKFPMPPNSIYAHFSTLGVLLETETVDAKGKEVETTDLEGNDQKEEETCECH